MTTPTIIPFDREAALEPWSAIPASDLVAGTPVQSGRTLLHVPDLGLEIGIWECTAQTSVWMDYSVNEWMVVLEGEITIIEVDHQTTFGPGDVFVLPKGLRCQWHQSGTVRKFYAIFDDPSGAVNPGPLTRDPHRPG